MSSEVAVEMKGGKWKRYPAYRDSGVEWIGEMPEGWEVKRLRFLFQFLDNYRIPVAGEDRAAMTKMYPYYGASGIIDYVDDYIFNESLILVAEDGANLLSRSTPLAFIATGKYWVNNHAHILRPINGQLLFWEGVLQTYDYSPLITGAAQPKLTKENLGSILLPSPPIDEQRVIASFLNRETGRIDTLIEKKGRQIELLQEKRAALISHAVTKGLDPGVKMKDSGVEWLGEVPKHWKITVLKRVCKNITDGSHFSPEIQYIGIPYVTVQDIKDDYIDFDNCKRISENDYLALKKNGCQPNRGDVLLTKDGTIGKAIVIKENRHFVILSSLGMITPNQLRILSEYMRYYLISGINIDQMFSFIRGSALTRLTIKLIKDLVIVIPPPSEQQSIVTYIDDETGRIDYLLKKIRESISKLREYRTALISAAVTGKIDVRNKET